MTATQKVTVEVTPETAILRVANIVKVIRFETVRKWAVQTIKKQWRGVYMPASGNNVELFADQYDNNILTEFADFARWAARYYAESQIGKIADLYYRQNGEPMIAELRREVVENIKAIAAQELDAVKAELDK